jgi:hypothetical protein
VKLKYVSNGHMNSGQCKNEHILLNPSAYPTTYPLRTFPHTRQMSLVLTSVPSADPLSLSLSLRSRFVIGVDGGGWEVPMQVG